MNKVTIGIITILMCGCCVHFAALSCAAQDPPSSPRITALEKRLKAGDRSALESFWQRAAQEGTPMIEPAPGEARHVLATFLWRATSETRSEEHTSQLHSPLNILFPLLLQKKNKHTH